MTPLPPGYGLRILKCNSIHTFGMRFALDLVWLGRDGRVLRVDHGVAPRRMKLCVRARSVVETAAGRGRRASPLPLTGCRRLYWTRVDRLVRDSAAPFLSRGLQI